MHDFFKLAIAATATTTVIIIKAGGDIMSFSMLSLLCALQWSYFESVYLKKHYYNTMWMKNYIP